MVKPGWMVKAGKRKWSLINNCYDKRYRSQVISFYFLHFIFFHKSWLMLFLQHLIRRCYSDTIVYTYRNFTYETFVYLWTNRWKFNICLDGCEDERSNICTYICIHISYRWNTQIKNVYILCHHLIAINVLFSISSPLHKLHIQY
jgi:hypothetical protein